MPNEIQCPSCSSPNRPGATRCHACERKLPTNPEPPAELPSVVLHRVMRGEVFAALPGELGKRSAPTRRSPSTEDEVVHITPPVLTEPAVEDHSDVIAAAVDRIRAKSREEGQGFKPYVRSRNRKPATAQAKQEITKHLETAVGLFRERRFEEAIEPLLKAIARDDEDRRAWILLAEAYLRADRTYKAAVGYLRALELSPRDEQGWLGLGRILRSIGELPTAAAVLDRATELHPEHVDTWAERGFVMEALRDPAEAMRSFDQVLAVRPDHRVARSKRADLEAQLAAASSSTEPGETSQELATEGAASASDEAPIEDDILEEMEEVFASEARLGPTQVPESRDALTIPARGAEGRPARVRTFIEGLDEILEGGIPWGHVVLLEGAPGTMKSSIGFSLLLQNAAREGLHCLYLSLEERASSLLKQMGSLGVQLEVTKGSLVVLDPKTATGLLGERSDWIEALEEGIRSIKAQRGLDLIVIDSLEALEVLAKFKDRRREMYRLFEWLRDLDVTSFVITERPDWLIAGHVLQGRWDEDFLADGVVHLRIHMLSDLDAQRRLRVVKMRGTKHETGYLAMDLDDGRFRVTRAIGP